MKIVFMGTPDFAVPCLEALVNEGHDVAGVFSQPDKPVGRKQIITPPPVKKFALEQNITVFQPQSLKNSDSLQIINELKPDIIVVVAYGKILPKEILSAAKYGCINVHASLLPKYRGAAPIQWAILNGEKQTGVCVMQMDEGLDTGDILLTKVTDIDIDETSQELFSRLSAIGANALTEALKMIENNEIKPQKQPSGEYQYASMITKKMSPIDWNRSSFEIHNQVRGLQTWPCATTVFCNKNIKIHKTQLTDISCNFVGEIVENKKELLVGCGDGKCLRIITLQPDGKKRMDANAFLQGYKPQKGSRIGE